MLINIRLTMQKMQVVSRQQLQLQEQHMEAFETMTWSGQLSGPSCPVLF